MNVDVLMELLSHGPVGVLAFIAYVLWRMERGILQFISYQKGRNEVNDELERWRDTKLRAIHNDILRRNANDEEDKPVTGRRIADNGV